MRLVFNYRDSYDYTISFRCGARLYLPLNCRELCFLTEEKDVLEAYAELGGCRLEQVAVVSDNWRYWWALASLVDYDAPSPVMWAPTPELGALSSLYLAGKGRVLLEVPWLTPRVAVLLAGVDVDVLAVHGGGAGDVVVAARRPGFRISLREMNLSGIQLERDHAPRIDHSGEVVFEPYRSPCTQPPPGLEQRSLPDPLEVAFPGGSSDARAMLREVFASGTIPVKTLADLARAEPQHLRVMERLVRWGFLEVSRELVAVTAKGLWALGYEEA
ncbi:hypothetical protein MA03_07145 [Infirmifilum uzonense]|uniref:Uncharacterized protein n=1 Tax=Infirmifilum uzonense TaxID=1550241 RepID=A0A0F7FI89_9CREN|nr:hypothetical protein [Infirmifilum uzonense]AKG39055.1 hypothetical protein MA03_07145 [Infirmifilum uzonense]